MNDEFRIELWHQQQTFEYTSIIHVTCVSDLVVNAQVQSPAVKQEHNRHARTFISKIAIIYGSRTIVFRARSFIIDNMALQWKPSNNVTIQDIRVSFLTKRQAFIEIGTDITFVVLRHLSSYPSAKKMDFLGFYVENGEGLSDFCHGLIGKPS